MHKQPNIGDGQSVVDTQCLCAITDTRDGQISSGTQSRRALPQPLSNGGQLSRVTQVLDAPRNGGEEGQWKHDTHLGDANLASIIFDIRAQHDLRKYWMGQRIACTNRLSAKLRTFLGWKIELPSDELKHIEASALALIELGENIMKGKELDKEDANFIRLGMLILVTLEGRKVYDSQEEIAKKNMEKLAKQLPVWPHISSIKGAGALGLAIIIGESGDLNNYAHFYKVWRRFGFAPITKNGVTRAASTWRRFGGLTDKEWEDVGYSPPRRALSYANIGENLIRANDAYKVIYDNRKAYLCERAKSRGLTIVPAGKIPKDGGDKFLSKKHLHMDSMRYMEKIFLRDLWREWRRAYPALTPNHHMPASNELESQQ